MRTIVFCLLVALAACAPTHGPAAGPDRAPIALRVDHAWVKDAKGAEQKKRRQTMEALRAKIANGGGFIESWNSLRVNGAAWHVAEQETYEYGVIPPQARDLPVGSLSPIIPGDGGLHLFRILGREYGG